MKVAVIGSGGREHALLWKIAQNKDVGELVACPGNAGTESLARSFAPAGSGVGALVDEILRLKPDLVVVGPEQPLADGIVDRLIRADIACFGPTARAARIEASKVFAKELMRRHDIPTADFEVFDEFDKLRRFIASNPRREGRVVKADGLAAGKGAYVCASDDETLETARQLLIEGSLGEAGRRVVVEEKLAGIEASAHYWCDGERFAALPMARDYKRALDGDAGPNTGGMGTLCPAGHVSAEQVEVVERTIVAPTLKAMTEEGCPYRGLLYVGLMLTESGPQVIEFNCRFGDPETQVMMPVLQGDVVATMIACTKGELKADTISSRAHGTAVCVVLAAEGYPGPYEKNIRLKTATEDDQHLVFHAGTRREGNDLLSGGGRVLNAVGRGPTLEEARANAYELAERLLVPGLRFRKDIALQGVEIT